MPFDWTAASEEAAGLVAEGELTVTQIADKVGTTRRSVTRWKANADFNARVEQILAQTREKVKDYLIAKKDARMACLNDRWLGLQRVKKERGAHADMQSAPGGKTGLLSLELKSIGAGEKARIIAEFKVDTGLCKTMLEHEEQAAREMGQWQEKHEHSGPGKGPIPVIVIPSIIPLNEAEIQERALPVPKKRT